jgi:hypothetical protein
MANVLDQLSLGQKTLYVVDSAPNGGAGLTANVGDLALVDAAPAYGLYVKVSSSALAWTIMATDANPALQFQNAGSNIGVRGTEVTVNFTGAGVTATESSGTVTVTIPGGGGGSSTWGSITGTLSSQTDLQSALNAKQNTLVSGTSIKTVNGSTLLGSGDLAVTASAAGSTGQIQYNNAGALGGSANAKIDSGDLIIGSTGSNPSTPASDKVKLWAKRFGPSGSRTMLAAVGPSGLDYTLQPAMWRQGVAFWRPPGNATTVPGVFGMAAPTTGGTGTSRSVATTNALTRAKRIAYVSTAIAANYAGHYSTAAQYTLGNGTIGGFFYSCRFGTSDASLQSAARTFVGISSSVAAPTNVDPGTLTNCIGIGHNAADTNWFIYYGGSAAQARIDLGVNFPINTTDLLDFTLWSPPNQSGVVYYYVERITTTGNQVASGQLGPGTAGVTLPATTTLLAHRAWRNNNTVAVAVGIDLASVYWETDW